MPYIINKTDGSIVATINDGTIDTSSTSLTLIGKNYKGIGEFYNENLVFLLENFANSAPPSRQVKGQLWFNSNSNKLNVYDGQTWRPVGSPFVSNNRPNNLVAGDLWIDRLNKQLKFFDGINLLTAGPSYTESQGKTGWIPEEIIDRRGNTRTVASMYVANSRVAIFNDREFSPLLPIPGFTTDIDPLKAGFTFSSLIENNNINAPSEISLKLLDPLDGELDSSKFIRSDKSGSIEGSLSILDPNGILIGANANFSVYIDLPPGESNNRTVISNRETDTKTIFEVRSEDGFQTPLEFDPVEKSVKVYPNFDFQNGIPKLDINANTVIRGSLVVFGETQFTNSTTLQISDKNIELAVVDNPTNVTANGAGITVLGQGGNNKTITWLSSGITVDINTQLPSWTFNDNIQVTPTKSFFIGNNLALSLTTLGPSIVNSSLTSVGDLVNLNAADFNFTTNKLTVKNNKDLIITVDPTKFITLENRVRITNVEVPFSQFDVANKEYVDTVKTSNNFLTVDVTGLLDPNTSAVNQINALFPSVSARINDEVRVLFLSYENGPDRPIVTRTLKFFRCETPSGVRTWVYQPNRDIDL